MPTATSLERSGPGRGASVLLLCTVLSGCAEGPPGELSVASVEQKAMGERPPATMVASFDGLGVGFTGPQGPATGRNPSDNSLAVGPDHIVQTVNSRLAIFTKKGQRFDTAGRVLYGAVPTNTVFQGFGGTCEARNNGDAAYAPDGFYRRMASPAIDRMGNIGIGYSFGDTPRFAGQRFAARLADDPPGILTLQEAVLVEGDGAQTGTLRWEDYTQTAIDPSDDCTIWYVGDYFKRDADSYSTRIGAFGLPGCDG